MSKLKWFGLLFVCFLVHADSIDRQIKKILDGAVKANPPQKEWVRLAYDQAFTFKEADDRSFIRNPTAIHMQNGMFYIVDNFLHRVVVFDLQGNFMRKIGSRGEGPGELKHPTDVCVAEGKVYIKNSNGIDVFTEKGVFERRIRCFLAIYRMQVFGGSFYVIPSDGYKGNYPAVVRLNMQGAVQEQYFAPGYLDGFRFKMVLGSVLPANDSILFIPRSWGEIHSFSVKTARPPRKNRIAYGLCEEIERINEIERNNKDPQVLSYAPVICKALRFEGSIYVLLMTSRLEILRIDESGRVLEHYYNDTTFTDMSWNDFAVMRRGNRLSFLLLAWPGSRQGGNMEYEYFKVDAPLPAGARG